MKSIARTHVANIKMQTSALAAQGEASYPVVAKLIQEAQKAAVIAKSLVVQRRHFLLARRIREG